MSEARIAQLVGEPIERATPEFVREQSGFAIGGVAPIAHAQPTLVEKHRLATDVTNVGAIGLRVVHLADVHACDSSGVGALVDLRLKTDRPIVLLRPSEHLRRVLHVMKVMSLFEVMDDEELLGR